MTRNTRLV